MITFITWTAIAILLWRVEMLAHQIALLQRGQINPPKPEQTPKAQPQQPAGNPSIFEPLPQTDRLPKQTPAAPIAPAQETTPKPPLSLDKIFSWVGGFILLLGIIFCIKYSIEKNLISPQVRVVLGTLTGIILWASGALIKKENLKTTAHTLLACGLCVCYLTWFAAYAFYHIFSAQTAFGLLALIALSSFATALWKKAFYIGILAQVIGFLTPFLLVSGAAPVYWFLLGYGALITVSAVASSFKFQWDSQIYVAIILSSVYLLAFTWSANNTLLMGFAILLGAVFATAAAIKRNGSFLLGAFIAQVPLLLVLFVDVAFYRQAENPFLIAAALWWAVFTLLPLLLKVHFIADKRAWATSCACGLFIGLIMQIIVWSKGSSLDGGWIPLLFALAYGGIFYLVYAWEEITSSCQRLRLSMLGSVCALFVSVLIYCTLCDQWLPIALSLQGAFLVYLYKEIKLPVWQTLGTILLSLGTFHLCFLSYSKAQPFLLNTYLYTYALCAVACFAGARFWRETTHRSASTYLQFLGSIILFALLNIEIASYFSQGKGLSFNLCGEVTEAAAYTLAWALCGAGCLLFAVRPLKWLSGTGIVLIVLALLKLFLSDIWQLPLSLRIMVSIAVAFILLGISFYYQQQRRN